jgi:hypothetical protein
MACGSAETTGATLQGVIKTRQVQTDASFSLKLLDF